MVKLANLFFLLFATVSPKPLFLNNTSSSMDVEANPNISPVVLFKSNTLPIETNSSSTKLNPLPMKPKLPTSWQSWMSWMPVNVYGLLIIGPLLLFVILVFLVIRCCPALPKDLAGCVNQCCHPIDESNAIREFNANSSKKTSFEEI